MRFSLGSHSMTHPDLRPLKNNALKCKLTSSHKLIAATGETFKPFAYPGAHSRAASGTL
jgi:hypothetical protein